MKTGLVMEGGAMRGMFTAGVIDVMMENGIKYDGAVGVSAGAVFGCNYKSNQPGRAIRFNVAYCNNPNYAGFRSWVHTGNVYGEQFCYHDIPDRLDPFDFETYRRNPMEFYVVATDINCGDPVYKKMERVDKNGLLWLRASASIPLASKIVCVDNYELLDGGIADAVPLEFMEKKGYERNVVVLTRPLGYRKKRSRTLPAAKAALRNYPKMIEAMESRYIRYNANIEYIKSREKEDKVFVIRPPRPIETSAVERSRQKLLDAYHMGRKTMEQQLEALNAFLK